MFVDLRISSVLYADEMILVVLLGHNFQRALRQFLWGEIQLLSVFAPGSEPDKGGMILPGWDEPLSQAKESKFLKVLFLSAGMEPGLICSKKHVASVCCGENSGFTGLFIFQPPPSVMVMK